MSRPEGISQAAILSAQQMTGGGGGAVGGTGMGSAGQSLDMQTQNQGMNEIIGGQGVLGGSMFGAKSIDETMKENFADPGGMFRAGLGSGQTGATVINPEVQMQDISGSSPGGAGGSFLPPAGIGWAPQGQGQGRGG